MTDMWYLISAVCWPPKKRANAFFGRWQVAKKTGEGQLFQFAWKFSSREKKFEPNGSDSTQLAVQLLKEVYCGHSTWVKNFIAKKSTTINNKWSHIVSVNSTFEYIFTVAIVNFVYKQLILLKLTDHHQQPCSATVTSCDILLKSKYIFANRW